MDGHYPFSKQPPPRDWAMLPPGCWRENQFLHYSNIYGKSVEALNRLLAPLPQYQGWSLEQLLTGELLLPPALAEQIRYQAGAVYGHNLYFGSTSPSGAASRPGPALRAAIHRQYGSVENLSRLLRLAAQSLTGPGWVWLNAVDGEVHISTSLNNQTPALDVMTPILAADLWEHAYYRCDPTGHDAYLAAWLAQVDWGKAEQRYEDSLGGPAGGIL